MRSLRSPEPGAAVAPSGGYMPGIDGLRAIAVLAVLLFHGGAATFSGGFLGVDVFFVVSGYLITLLLVREHHDNGRISLPGFWLRRARRLLPAVAALLVITVAYADLFLPAEVTGLRADALASLGYVTNWWLSFGNQPYFETMGRPSLLQHLWSLAVEEQFYLAWPIALAALLKLGGRRTALVVAVGGAVASYGLMWALYSPESDPSRIYYGTDTRAGALLLGAALALLWDPRRLGGGIARKPTIVADLAGAGAVAALAWAFVKVEPTTSWLYPWGFLLVAAGTGIALASVVYPGSSGMLRVLAARPMRWAGTRSYGLYLWHWPIFMVTRPGLDVPFDGLDLLLGRLVLAVIAAEISYRLIEQPFRSGGFRRVVRTSLEQFPVPAKVVSFGGGFAAVALFLTTAQADPAEVPAYLAAGSFQGVVGTAPAEIAAPRSSPTSAPTASPTSQPTLAPTATPTEVSATPTEIPPAATPTPEATEPTPTPPPPPPPPTQPPPAVPPPTGATILAIGDSVLMGAAPYLGIAGPVEVDAAIGRQVGDTIRRLREYRDAGRLPEVVVFHTGNNGPLTGGQIDELMSIAGDAKVVFVTVRVGRSWEDTTNGSIRAAVARYANIRVADWYAASEARPDIFYSDGIHIRGEGGPLFAAVVAAAIAS